MVGLPERFIYYHEQTGLKFDQETTKCGNE